jgi:hypothetical protein
MNRRQFLAPFGLSPSDMLIPRETMARGGTEGVPRIIEETYCLTVGDFTVADAKTRTAIISKSCAVASVFALGTALTQDATHRIVLRLPRPTFVHAMATNVSMGHVSLEHVGTPGFRYLVGPVDLGHLRDCVHVAPRRLGDDLLVECHEIVRLRAMTELCIELRPLPAPKDPIEVALLVVASLEVNVCNEGKNA